MFNAAVLEVSEEDALQRAIRSIGVETKGRPILTRKGVFRVVRLQGVGYREVLIAKQEMLGAGGDAATHKGMVEFSKDAADVLLLGTGLHFRRFVTKMKSQPFKCRILAEEVEEVLANYSRRAFTLRFPKGELKLNRTLVMGVLNVTPDSFSDGGRYLKPKAAVARGVQMVEEGADILDVGGESTRPGSQPVSPRDEWRRLEPVLQGLAKSVKVPISVDTYRPETATRALDAGVSMVNDVTGLGNPDMVQVVAKHNVPVVIMHMLGEPRTMQKNPRYEDVVADVLRFLRDRVKTAIEAGVDRDQILVDPGLGFGKTLAHNLEILRRLGEFRSLGQPILVGASRKSFLGQVLDLEPDQRLEGGLAAAVLAASKGASVVRTHDVEETIKALRVTDAIRGAVPEGD